MGTVVDYSIFRTLRACRQINETSEQILRDVQKMREDANATGEALAQSSQTLEQTLHQFDLARARLHEVGEQHRRVMLVVEKIMAESPAFRP